MEVLTSRKNARIRHFRALGTERAYRREQGEFLCDGWKMLREALSYGAEVMDVICCGEAEELPASVPVYQVDRELLRYVSPLENSPGPVFSVKMPRPADLAAPRKVLVLENVQDPGNVGTVLRTAAAFCADLVILCGECADPYNPKTVRATMGAIFRQSFCEMDRETLSARLKEWGLPLYAAALTAEAKDISELSLCRCAVAVGNEGRGLTAELLAMSDEQLIIPMSPNSESLNAAVAASVILWEMSRA